MNQGRMGIRGGAILPAPACDLLDRLTEELEIHFTLTDLHGAVVASTGGRPAGQVELRALRLLERGGDGDAAAPDGGDGGVYLPVRLSGRVAGVLVTHGEPASVATAARTAAVAIGLALDFSEAAAGMAQENVNPGWLLYRLFRGSREEAQQTRVMSAIYGWNLCVQRVAVVALLSDPAPDEAGRRRGDEPLTMLQRLLGRAARDTPMGQMDEAQWVLLPAHEPGGSWSRIRDLAEAVRAGFAAAGTRADVGIGEPHLPVNPVSALRRSYREAVYAARLGPRLGAKTGVHELRSLGPAAFFAPSSPSRRNLAALVLDPLRGHPAALETLRAYLALDLSVAETAAQLQVHRHTVRNHLERVFSLTGLDPRSLEGALQLKLALLVAASDPDVSGE